MTALALLLALVALMLVTLLLGVHLFGLLSMNPALRAVDAGTYIRVKCALDITAPRLAKPLMLSCLVVTAAALAVSMWIGALLVVPCAIALVALVVTLVAILRGDLPINREMATWSPEAPPEDWRSVRARWERYFLVRVVANAAAAVALGAATVAAATPTV